MRPQRSTLYEFGCASAALWGLLLCVLPGRLSAAGPAGAGLTNATVLAIENKVEVARFGSSVWDPAYVKPANQVLHPGDRLRTGRDSRALLRLSNLTDFPVGELTELEIPREQKERAVVRLLKGVIYFFHRDRPGEFQVDTPTVSAVVRGTEFNLEAGEDGTSNFRLLDGELSLSNAFGRIELVRGQEAVVKPGQAPVRTAVIMAGVADTVQWCLYYPAILHLDELPLSAGEQQALSGSLVAYRTGDLLAALAAYPEGRQPASEAEKIYRAALLLAVGKVRESETLIASVPPDLAATSALGTALRTLVAAVKFQPLSDTAHASRITHHASALLAESYYQQSQFHLESALEAARGAIQLAPDFAFAWTHLAELEFGFGRTKMASAALERGLRLAPDNAQAVALKGFLLAAQNRLRDAVEEFDHAILLDGALGNAWLGRGLCRIRQRCAEAGLSDLLVAATLEPQRSLLRSYLGKAFAHEGDGARAAREFKLARDLDPNDPTSWLYAALLEQRQNQINAAILSLDASQARNDNRSLFRSRLLLDEDRAVRSANLASIYRDAGMAEVAVREAARAAAYDYANDAAHLFLSDSYNELRDPTRFNLRYETVWFNELLLANLFAPVGAGRLSQPVSAQEYSRLFQADGLRLAASTDVRSDGQLRQLASQSGAFGNSAWSLDVDYQRNHGVRVNHDLDRLDWYTSLKQQLTPQDTALLLLQYEDYHSGDNFQYFDPAKARPHFQFDEYAQPILLGGLHHEWAPGVHTLALAGRLVTEQHFSDRAAPQLFLAQDPSGMITAAFTEPMDVKYRNEIEIFSAELNQVLQRDWFSLSAGGRYQAGTFDTTARLYNPPPGLSALFDSGDTNAISSSDDFERLTSYGYLTVEPFDGLWLTAGLTYDDITYPLNFRHPPISSGEAHRAQTGPKAALVWSPLPEVTLRGTYTRSLGGVSLDENYRLEPTQLAGFPQTFRSLISESVVGSVSAPAYTTYGAALDLKLGARTFAGVQAQQLQTDVRRQIGLFVITNGAAPGATSEQLEYRERSFALHLNQLMGRQVVAGLNYQFLEARLHDTLPRVPLSVLPAAHQVQRAGLHQLGGYLLYNHPSGFFARADVQWYHQHNSGYTPALGDSDFVQENLFAGWRFDQRRAEIMFGLLNLGGADYHLNPLTASPELPRRLVFEARLSFEF